MVPPVRVQFPVEHTLLRLPQPLLGMADIVVLDVLVILYLVRSANVRAAAAWLFVPYLCWILFATYLNAYILVANGTGL